MLDALTAYGAAGGREDVDAAVESGQRFFLAHSLFLSHRTGEVANPVFLRYPFPPQWHFDILRGLEHFRLAGAARNLRLERAVDVIRKGQRTDGTWYTHRPYPGHSWFPPEPRGPSRWATLRCARVLRWWDEARFEPGSRIG